MFEENYVSEDTDMDVARTSMDFDDEENVSTGPSEDESKDSSVYEENTSQVYFNDVEYRNDRFLINDICNLMSE